MITATYVNVSQFLVTETDPGQDLRLGQVVECDLGTDGTLITDITALSLDVGTGITTVTVVSAALTANLVSVAMGPLFNDRSAQQSNIAQHFHEYARDGGLMPASGFVDSGTVERLNSLAGVSPYLAGYLMGVKLDGGLDVAKYQIKGVANRTTIVQDANSITISTPQDQHTGASPMYAGLTLSALSGMLTANPTTHALSGVVPSAGNQIVKTNTGNTSWEAVDFLLSSLGDTGISGSVESGKALIMGGDGKWGPGYPTQAGAATTIGGSSIGLVFAICLALT
jgi:hypothetical protein